MGTEKAPLPLGVSDFATHEQSCLQLYNVQTVLAHACTEVLMVLILEGGYGRQWLPVVLTNSKDNRPPAMPPTPAMAQGPTGFA